MKVFNIFEVEFEVVYLLVKWKCYILVRFGFNEGEGFFVYMKVFCLDEDFFDLIYLVYVD